MRRSEIDEMMTRAVPGARIRDVMARTGGELSTVFEVRLDGAAPVILKIYDDVWAWKQAKEVAVYGLLAEVARGYVPEVLHVESAGSGPAFTVLTRLDGRPLSEVALEPAEWRQVYRQVGRLVARIHEVGQPAYGYLVAGIVDPEPDNASYMGRQFAKKLREFAGLGGDQGLHHEVERYVAARADSFANCAAPVLCHNDLHEGNVLVRPGDGGWVVSGLVDVENAVAADPLLDLAKTECYSIRGDQSKHAGLIEGYGALPADWAARLELYRLYHALELWDWFASIGTTDPLPGIATDMADILAGGAGGPADPVVGAE
ncbi:MAG TPA: aminoglycoside phosphotransferase family protein [Jiangellaceae bacterium]